jgi:hypothetical protein
LQKFWLAVDECFDDVRIKVSAGLFEDDRRRDLMGEMIFVNPFGGERVVDVGHGQADRI